MRGADWKGKLACDDHDFAFHAWTGGRWGNFLEDWDVFEFTLVWDWVYELLAQGGESSLCNGCHFDGRDEMKGENNKGKSTCVIRGEKEESKVVS
jgi:hypothetical protein